MSQITANQISFILRAHKEVCVIDFCLLGVVVEGRGGRRGGKEEKWKFANVKSSTNDKHITHAFQLIFTNQINYSCRTIISNWFVTCNSVWDENTICSSGSDDGKKYRPDESINIIMAFDRHEYRSNVLRRCVIKSIRNIARFDLLSCLDNTTSFFSFNYL